MSEQQKSDEVNKKFQEMEDYNVFKFATECQRLKYLVACLKDSVLEPICRYYKEPIVKHFEKVFLDFETVIDFYIGDIATGKLRDLKIVE